MTVPNRAGVDATSPTPLYHQIYLLYRQQILAGEIPHGARLPSEEEITALFGVSRITAKRALNELASDGLVDRTRRRGTTVLYRAAPTAMAGDFSGFMQALAAIGASTEVDVLSVETVPASPDVAAALTIAPAAEVRRIERRRRRGAVLFSHSLTHLPADIGGALSADDLARRPVLALVEAAGQRIGGASQAVTAVLADPRLARHLDTPIGAPLLKLRRVVRSKGGRPIQDLTVHYRPDVFQLHMTLESVASTGDDTPRWFGDMA